MNQQTYTTLDSYQAAFLVLRKHRPKLIQQGSKIVFSFNATDTLYQNLDDYNTGAQVEAIVFAITIKSLKSQIFSMKKDNGYKDGIKNLV